MPAALATKQEILERLLATFRRDGYDGASLAELSARTGLGRSSLYHHFPGGKLDMAEQVLAHLEAQLERQLFEPARSHAPPQDKLDAMLDVLDAFYDGGRTACMLERLCASVERDRFRRPLAALFKKWIDAVAALGREAGLPRATARARAEDLVIRIEGALIVCAGTDDPKPFRRTIAALRSSVLAP
jgi:TetR/AcrR family transcriptional repressor of lmrAB and yxaGH operons